MNGQQWAPMCAGFAVAVVLFLVLGYFLRKRDMTAHLAPVKRELKKEKQWLRRGEYNAAMVKGRQNLELFLKLVAEFNGIELDNSAQAMANAKSGLDGRGQRETYRMNGRKRQRVMTFQQFGWWLDENGYLDRVGKWELNEIRVIGNKAVHENYVSKEDAGISTIIWKMFCGSSLTTTQTGGNREDRRLKRARRGAMGRA